MDDQCQADDPERQRDFVTASGAAMRPDVWRETAEQGARDVVSFATEVTKEGDNATCLVIRLGGWERRLEGGVGSLGTKESREWRRQEATDPRRSRT